MINQNRRKTRKMKGGGGTFSSVKKSSPKSSPKGSPESNKKTVSFNKTVRKRKSPEDNNSDNSEEEDISDKHTPKRKKKNPVRWSRTIKSKNSKVLNNLNLSKEKAHTKNWNDYSGKKIDREEYNRRQNEIKSQLFIGGNKKRKTRRYTKSKKSTRKMKK